MNTINYNNNDLTNVYTLNNTNNMNGRQFSSNFAYRNFLTSNGNKILELNVNNTNNYQQCNCNYLNSGSTPLTTNSPFLFNSITQKDTPYGYTESDLKTNFIDKRLRQYAQNGFRMFNAIEYIYNKPYTDLLTNVTNEK